MLTRTLMSLSLNFKIDFGLASDGLSHEAPSEYFLEDADIALIKG
jgi:hypothetical protein